MIDLERWGILNNSTRKINPVRRSSFIIRGALLFSDFISLVIPFFLIRVYKVEASILFYKETLNGGMEKINTGMDWYFLLIVLLIFYWVVSGFYGARKSIWDEVYVILVSLAVAAATDALVLFSAGYSNGPFYFLISWILSLLFIVFLRGVTRKVLSHTGFWEIQTIIIGSESNIKRAYEVVKKQKNTGYDVVSIIGIMSNVGFLSDIGGRVGFLEVKNVDEVIDFINFRPNFHIVMALDDKNTDFFYKIIDYLASRPNTLDIIPTIRGLPLYGTDIVHLFGEEILMLRVRNNLSRLAPRIFKRSFDITASLMLVIFLSPVFLILSCLIKMEDGGSPFYLQLRVGRDGLLFPCYKFRSMRTDAEAILESWKAENPVLYAEYKTGNFKLKNDPRVTRIGRFMRAHSLDELPQLINVIKGQMALIGPRPLIEREVAEYGVGIIHYHRARPGITGLWQVSGRSKTRFADRAFYDEWYVKNWSVWLDVVILIKTIGVVLGKEGAY